MRVLITGGAGFIGSNYVKHVLSGNLRGVSRVTVLDKLTYAGTLTNLANLPSQDLEFVEGDICDEVLVNELITRQDAVVNFAAESHVDRSISGSKDFVLTNVLGTHTLLEAARRKGDVTFVQVSTDEVYGSVATNSSLETDPLLPNSPYSASKASGDLLARSYFKTHGLDVRVTRCSNNYGPNQFPEKIIPLFITNLMEGKKVPVYGDGRNVRDWLHVDDHCQGIHLALMNGEAGNIYNIGGGAEVSNIELTREILRLMDKDESNLDFVADRLGHDFRYSVDHGKISKELGYSPKVAFSDGLSATLNWYQENEAWWRPLKYG
jgi:dTDP-glucose 4,6-dehydratase